MRTLHVVEALGGVQSSLMAMVDATPGLEHHLAVWPRRSHVDTGDSSDAFVTVTTLPSGRRAAIAEMNRLVDRLRPDVVHAHSSYAGMLARVARTGDARVAYSPHCFAFERRDLGVLARSAYRAAERALAVRTDVLTACSPYEAHLARQLGYRDVVVVPNRALNPPALEAAYDASSFRVVLVGRLCPQKDWPFVLEAKRHLEQTLGLYVEWEWLGAGDAHAEQALADAGVAVSGWLPRAEILRRMSTAQVFAHAAAWEGAPMSILEAAAVGLPMAVRGIPSVVSMGVPGASASVADLARRIQTLHDPAQWNDARLRSLEFSAQHSAQAQQWSLSAAYGFVPSEFALI